MAVAGKAAVLAATARNLAALQTLTIQVLHHDESTDAVTAELKITMDARTGLLVVDVIAFKADGRIQAIKACLGCGDGSAKAG